MRRPVRTRFPARVLFGVLLATGVARAAAPLSIRPSDTDPRISEFNSPHLAWTPAGTSRNRLLVFLPGTGGTPRDALHYAFLTTAAGLGYHVVALMYPDKIAAQRQCSHSDDPDAYLKFRRAVIRGGVIGVGRTIAAYDSIESRLTKLLAYLDAHQPGQGWAGYLGRDGGIQWRLVAAAGHSQGGGHSYMLGKDHEVDRVLLFGSPKDYSFHFDAPARGFDANTKTPLDRFFVYNHVGDNKNGCTHLEQLKIVRQIGLVDLGVADADTEKLTNSHAHVIYTNTALQRPADFHSCILNGNLSINQPVWEYMLTAPVNEGTHTNPKR
jgi:hypothetical protein